MLTDTALTMIITVLNNSKVEVGKVSKVQWTSSAAVQTAPTVHWDFIVSSTFQLG